MIELYVRSVRMIDDKRENDNVNAEYYAVRCYTYRLILMQYNEMSWNENENNSLDLIWDGGRHRTPPLTMESGRNWFGFVADGRWISFVRIIVVVVVLLWLSLLESSFKIALRLIGFGTEYLFGFSVLKFTQAIEWKYSCLTLNIIRKCVVRTFPILINTMSMEQFNLTCKIVEMLSWSVRANY